MSLCTSISIILRSQWKNKTISFLQQQAKIKKRKEIFRAGSSCLTSQWKCIGPKQSTSIQYFGNKNSFMAVLILKMFHQQIPEKKMGKSLLSGSRGILRGGFRHLRYSSASQQKGNLFKMVYFWIFPVRNPIRFSSIVYNEKASDNTHVHIFSFLSVIYGHL